MTDRITTFNTGHTPDDPRNALLHKEEPGEGEQNGWTRLELFLDSIPNY